MPTIYKTNKGYQFTPNDNEVTISDNLYNFIQEQKQDHVSFKTINQTYNPKIPNIPMVDNLRMLPKARNGYNQNITRLNKAKKLLGANDELFKPYTAIKQATEKYQVLDEDTQTNFKGCYWGNLNPENLICLNSNLTFDFSTAYKGWQNQEEMPHDHPCYAFWKKWDIFHLTTLTINEWQEMYKDLQTIEKKVAKKAIHR